LDSILFGCALAVWKNPVLDLPPQYPRLCKYRDVPTALSALLLSVGFRKPEFRETWRYSLQGVALTFLFVAAIRFHEWPIFRILNVRGVAFMGVLSYSLYLVHSAVLLAVQSMAPSMHPLESAIIALGICIALSWAMYEVIERPCARLRRRLTD
jgi:peptidoglycan/LPS O-acetylase OafA/YrhL